MSRNRVASVDHEDATFIIEEKRTCKATSAFAVTSTSDRFAAVTAISGGGIGQDDVRL
jgi:hypothetical protein